MITVKLNNSNMESFGETVLPNELTAGRHCIVIHCSSQNITDFSSKLSNKKIELGRFKLSYKMAIIGTQLELHFSSKVISDSGIDITRCFVNNIAKKNTTESTSSCEEDREGQQQKGEGPPTTSKVKCW